MWRRSAASLVARRGVSLAMIAAMTVGGLGIAAPSRNAGVAGSVPPPAPPPVVTSVSPNTGPTSGGNAIVIYGQNLGNARAVYFYGASTLATVESGGLVIKSSTEIDIAQAPPDPSRGGMSATDVVDVVVQANAPVYRANTNSLLYSARTSADRYTYTRPVITSVTPNIGPVAGGNAVKILGRGFSTVTGLQFGGQTTTDFVVPSDTEIDVYSAPARPGGRSTSSS